MAVITPIRSEHIERDFREHDASPAPWLENASKWRSRLICAGSLMSADIVAFLISAVAAMSVAWLCGSQVLPQPGALSESAFQTGLLSNGFLLAGLTLCFSLEGHYWRRAPFWSELRDVLIASVIVLLCAGFLKYSLQRHDSRIVLILTWAFFPVAAIVMRTLARHVLSGAGIWQLRAVVVGHGETARQAESALLSEPRLGYSIVAVACPTDLNLRPGAGRWKRVLQQHSAELLVLALDTNDPGARALTESLVRERVPFAAMPRLGGLPVLGFEQTCFFSHDTVMFTYRNNLAQPIARVTKMVFDLGVAAFLLILAAPVLLVIAAAVKLDGGPILFAHRRVGANGREFPCFKFRSMVVDADGVLRRLLSTNPDAAAEWSETRKLRNDPRVTFVGRLLRSTSLDELPQLLNVLRLEMSLVGPRPIVRSEAARYAEDITYYYELDLGLPGFGR